MQFAVVSLFPEMFAAVSDHGVTGRAIKQGLVGLSHCNPRDFTSDRHRTVDDRPYGGGPSRASNRVFQASSSGASAATRSGAPSSSIAS